VKQTSTNAPEILASMAANASTASTNTRAIAPQDTEVSIAKSTLTSALLTLAMCYCKPPLWLSILPSKDAGSTNVTVT
jgi:hypothetical protein